MAVILVTVLDMCHLSCPVLLLLIYIPSSNIMLSCAKHNMHSSAQLKCNCPTEGAYAYALDFTYDKFGI